MDYEKEFDELLKEYKILSAVYSEAVEYIEKQQEKIEKLEEAIKDTEKSRTYWVNNYYYLTEQIIEEEERLGIEINYKRLKI